jgi:TolA-binding protein
MTNVLNVLRTEGMQEWEDFANETARLRGWEDFASQREIWRVRRVRSDPKYALRYARRQVSDAQSKVNMLSRELRQHRANTHVARQLVEDREKACADLEAKKARYAALEAGKPEIAVLKAIEELAIPRRLRELRLRTPATK